MNGVRTVTLALACTLVALTAGLWLGGHPEVLPDPLRDAFVDEDPAVRAELIDTIEDDFYRKVDTDKLEQQSLKGIVRALDDRFSNYLTPEEADQFRRGLAGKFEGVGMNVDEDKRGLKVLKVFEGSPAEKAGIRKGELITAVNGRSIAGVDSQVSTARIKGPPGTTVKLEVVSPHSGRKRTLTVERASIDVPVAESRVVERDGEKLGVVTLYTFAQDGTHGQLGEHVDRVLGRGADGVLLDLRGNGGGLLEEAVLVASKFIDDGTIVSTRGRTKPEREFDAQGDAISPEVPMVVLVDGGSASASEIVTGALRDTKRAIVVGTRTFGKGVFQEVDELSNRGVLDLTVGSYYLPSGENISDKGIKPSVRARDDPRTERDEALPVALDALARATR
jgi:carboxyl-terminal processing protease